MLHASSGSLAVQQVGKKNDLEMRQVIKKLLHLPARFLDITIHLPHRANGLRALELARAAAECQLKAFARLQRLNSSTVDAMGLRWSAVGP